MRRNINENNYSYIVITDTSERRPIYVYSAQD